MLHCSWDMVPDRCNYFHFVPFFAFLCPNRKIKIKNKWKNHLEISLFYISVPKTMIRWLMVPEIWCVTYIIVISYFELFFALLLPPLSPPPPPKLQNFEKMKKTPGYIIILHMCNKNYDQMMYGSWDMVHDECNYFSFWAIFCIFIPPTPQKINFEKIRKKHLDISSFYICVPKIMIR